MNDHLKTIMKQSWANQLAASANSLAPSQTACFEMGFVAATSVLLPLLKQCHPHVYGSHGAEHMLDGFNPQPRPIDGLLRELAGVLNGHA